MPQSELHLAALKCVADGYHVFPCQPGLKTPATATGFKEATQDVRQINAWWEANPDFNVAVATEASGLAVVDLDEWTGLEEWTELSAGQECPATLVVGTPRGGSHLYFRGSLPATQHKLATKIDTRGIGSYVLVPPSITVDGRYRYETSLPVAELPAWIPAHLASIKKTAPRQETSDVPLDEPWNIERAVAYLRNLAPVIEGDGSDSKTIAVACKLRDLGLSAGQAHETMLEHYDCQPLSEDWLNEKITNAYHYAENTPGIDAVASRPSRTFAIHAKALIEHLPRSRFKPYSEQEMDNLPEPTWLIPNLLPDQETAIVYGPSGSFKSFVALDLAMSVAAHTPTFAGMPTRSGLVFYVALEGMRNLMTKRRQAWRLARNTPEIPTFFVMNGPTMGEVADTRQDFLDAILGTAAGKSIAMVVIDTGAKMMAGTNENDARDAGAFVAFCDQIREALACNVLAILHSGKEAERGIRGSSAIYAGFDTVIALETERKKLVTCLRVEKHKDAEERGTPWYLRMVQIAGSLVPSEIEAKQFSEAVEGDNPLRELNVARTLKEFQAGIDGKPAVTTHVLASYLYPLEAGQLLEENARLQKGAVAALNKMAKDRLAAYCDVFPTGPMWRSIN